MGRLDLTQITDAAVDLLDEVGLAELSTRRLADKLGVRSPALYWYVKNKAELLDLVAEAICADAFDIDPDLPWRQQLASGLRQFRDLLVAHRDAAELLRQRPPTGPHRLGHVETTVRILIDAGFPDDDVAAISRLLAAHVLNFAHEATRPVSPPEGDYPHLRRLAPAYSALTGRDLFDLGVEILLDGLELRLTQTRLTQAAPRRPV